MFWGVIAVLILSAACYYDPVNTNHEILIINSRPGLGEVRAVIDGKTHLIDDLFYKAFFKSAHIILSAEAVHDDPRFSFWWFDNQYPSVIIANPVAFQVSNENWEIEAVFNWEQNTTPVILWDDSILFTNIHEGQRSLRRWNEEEEINLYVHDPGRIVGASIHAYYPAEHAFYKSGTQWLLIDSDFSISKSFPSNTTEIYPISNGTSLIHTKPPWNDNEGIHDLHFVSKDGGVAMIGSFSSDTRFEISKPGSAERLFAVERRQNSHEAYVFHSLHTIDMSVSSLAAESRLQAVENIPDWSNPMSASLESGYFLFNKYYSDYFLPGRYQFIVSDGEQILRSPKEVEPNFNELHRINRNSVRWISDTEFMAEKHDESWLRFSIENGELNFAPDPDYELPERPGIAYASSSQKKRGAVHSNEDWVVETIPNSGPTDLFLIHENGDTIQITGSEEG
ncbi:hypothetical protein JCM12856_01380 [Spirochaeta dissipatitropha]